MCHPCVKGEYQDLGDQTICISCGPSSTTLQEASNERSLCIRELITLPSKYEMLAKLGSGVGPTSQTSVQH